MPDDDFWSTTQNGAYNLNNLRFKKFLDNHDFLRTVLSLMAHFR